MAYNKITGISVGADLSRPSPIYRPSVAFLKSRLMCLCILSRTSPIMLMYKITWTPVGADLSRTPPIYRPSLAFTISLLFCLTTLSAFGG
jgi:hypothetical protein